MNINNSIRTIVSKGCKTSRQVQTEKMCYKDQALLLEDGPSFPPTSALTSAGRLPSFMKYHLLRHPIFFDEK